MSLASGYCMGISMGMFFTLIFDFIFIKLDYPSMFDIYPDYVALLFGIIAIFFFFLSAYFGIRRKNKKLKAIQIGEDKK